MAEILFLLDIANDILMPMPSFFTERLPVDLRPPELPAPILHRLRLSCLGSSPGMTKIVGSRTNDGSRPPLLRCLALGCAKTPKSLSLPHGERGEQGAPWGILGSGPRMTTEGRGSALGLTPHTFRTSHITHSSSTPRPGPTRHLRHRARSSRGQKSRRRRRLSGTGSPVRE